MNSSAKSTEALLKLLFAIEYSPKRKKADIHFRAQHSFLHVISGYCEYRTARESIKIESGDIAYLPKGAAYSYEFFDGCYCRQIEFDAGNVKFTDKKFPIKLASTDSNKALIASIVQKAESLRQSDGLLVLGSLYTLCSLIPETGNRLSKNSRIEPAVKYINEHFCEKFSIRTLAELCFMSEADILNQNSTQRLSNIKTDFALKRLTAYCFMTLRTLVRRRKNSGLITYMPLALCSKEW